jgi:hypothetical protein
MNATLNTLPYQSLGPIGIAGAMQQQTIAELERGLNIRIVPANGGTIISIRDETSFSSSSDLYVINQDQDISSELGKIITLHYLKK